MKLKYLIEKELKLFFRNPFLPKMAIAYPIMLMLILPLVVQMDVKNVKVCIVDCDYSSSSRRFASKIDASKYFHFAGMIPTYEQALQQLEHGDCDLILEIPHRFERNIETGYPVKVQIAANATDATKGGLGGNYLSNLVLEEVGRIAAEKGLSPQVLPEISVLNKYNRRMNYRTFMLPALMGMVIIIIAGIFPAFAIVGEKEDGTLEQMNVTPVSRGQFIFAKLLPYWIIGVIAMSLSFLVAFLAYGFVAVGSYLTIYASTILITLVMSSIGLIISNYSSTYQQAIFLFFFVMIISILMSGLFTPTTSMPPMAHAISTLLPPKYFMEIIRSVFLKGSGFNHLVPQFAALTAFATALSTIAVFTYRKRG